MMLFIKIVVLFLILLHHSFANITRPTITTTIILSTIASLIAQTGSTTLLLKFNSIGSDQFFTVPNNTQSIKVYMWGRA